MCLAPPKTLGEYRTRKLDPAIAVSSILCHGARRINLYFCSVGPYRAIWELKMLWPYVFGTPKNPGGYRSRKLDPAIAVSSILCHGAWRINLYFRSVGPYRAIWELKMLWPYVFGTPKNPGGYRNRKLDPAIAVSSILAVGRIE